MIAHIWLPACGIHHKGRHHDWNEKEGEGSHVLGCNLLTVDLHTEREKVKIAYVEMK